MHDRPIRCRRIRRSDADAVLVLLGLAGSDQPEPSRALRRRVRHVIADLGADCDVATIDEVVVGLVHVTYARRIVTGQRATLETLIVDPARRGRGVGAALARAALARARRRRCDAIDWRGPAAEDETRVAGAAFLTHMGWRSTGTGLRVDLLEDGAPTP